MIKATIPLNDQQMAALHQTLSSSVFVKKGGECHFLLLKYPRKCLRQNDSSDLNLWSLLSIIHLLLHSPICSVPTSSIHHPSASPSSICSLSPMVLFFFFFSFCFFLQHFGINDTWLSIGTSKIHKKEYVKQISKMEFGSLKMREVILCEFVLL